MPLIVAWTWEEKGLCAETDSYDLPSIKDEW